MKRGPPEQFATIEGLAQTGEGVCKIDGRTVLIAGALPGERVRLRTVRDSNHAELLGIDAPSPSRLVAPCDVVERCGGCAWQHAPAETQRDARLSHLRRALPPSAREIEVSYVPAPAAYGYRTRARLAWARVGGETLLGFRARARHEVVDARDCVVLDPRLSLALGPLREALGVLGGKGEVSLALGEGGAPVASVRPESMPGTEGFALAGRLVSAGFAGVSLWAPGATAATSAGDPRPVVRGGDGEPLRLAPEGFAQANEALNAHLAATVARVAQAAGKTVLELYAGAGNFTVLLARDAKRVVAVESDRAASAALAANVAARGITNVTPLADDAARAVASRKADVVVLDPPRAGAREVCELLAKDPPRRLVYVSCDPPTLGRDLAALERTMSLISLTAFEMFPQTPHLEVVAALERRGGRGR